MLQRYKWAGMAVVAILAVVIGAGLLTRQAYGKPHLSAYVPARDGSAKLLVLGASQLKVGAAVAALPAAAGAGSRTVANGNYSAVPAGVDASTPYGPPVARTDWVITKDYAAHGGHGNWGAVDFAFNHDYQSFGSPLLATHAGRVKLLHDDPTYGNLVYVIGPHFTTTYGHMQKFYVHDGDQVVRGTVLGEMGSTGHSTGPHVDYQVWQDGDNKNPMLYGIPGMRGPGVH